MSYPILGVVARLRRSMPRNAEVMLVCDEVERLVVEKQKPEKPKLTRAEIQRNYRLRKKGQA